MVALAREPNTLFGELPASWSMITPTFDGISSSICRDINQFPHLFSVVNLFKRKGTFSFINTATVYFIGIEELAPVITLLAVSFSAKVYTHLSYGHIRHCLLRPSQEQPILLCIYSGQD